MADTTYADIVTRRADNDWVSIAQAGDVPIVETTKACLVAIGHREVWVPKSQLGLRDFPQADQFGEQVCIPRWLAAQNRLLY